MHQRDLYSAVQSNPCCLLKLLFFFFSFQTYKAFLPAMIANNHGHLVSIASSAGLIGVNGLAGVCFSPIIVSFHSCQNEISVD